MDQISKLFENVKVTPNIFYIISTPIGNLADISLRAIKVLSLLDVIFCEDTRVTRKLLRHLNIKAKKLVVYNDHSDKKKRIEIINYILLKKNKKFGLVCDAGTPLISDPGFKLVRECFDNKIKITHVPGPSSIISSIVLSGIPPNNFYFAGYIEKNINKKKKQFKNILSLNVTTIWLETSQRILSSLELLNALYKDRKVSVLRELTKIHEEIITDNPEVVYNFFSKKESIKGEIVIVISGFTKKHLSKEDVNQLIKNNLKRFSTKELTSFISNKTGLPKKSIYNEIIKFNKLQDS